MSSVPDVSYYDRTTGGASYALGSTQPTHPEDSAVLSASFPTSWKTTQAAYSGDQVVSDNFEHPFAPALVHAIGNIYQNICTEDALAFFQVVSQRSVACILPDLIHRNETGRSRWISSDTVRGNWSTRSRPMVWESLRERSSSPDHPATGFFRQTHLKPIH